MEIKPVRQLEGNKTELIATHKVGINHTMVRYFNVPDDKIDEFMSGYKKEIKKNNVWKTLGLVSLVGITGGLATGKLFKNIWVSLGATALGTAAFFLGAFNIVNRRAQKAYQKLMKSCNAEEHTYLGKDGVPEVFDNKSPLIPPNVNK